jgi:ferredoxin
LTANSQTNWENTASFNLFKENQMAHTISDACVACGTCVPECPVGAISEGDPIYKINADACTDCGACASVCPAEAIAAK